MKKIIIFSGAGISAESGLKTFRDNDGLWENHNLMEVATPEAWHKDPKLVLDFYNIRRKQVIESQPNEGHKQLVKFEDKFDVQIITQNIDDLHERAGSSKVLHLHGEILKSRSTINTTCYPIKGSELNLGEFCEQDSQLRPDVVWFGENVPNMSLAEDLCENANILIIIGTSLSVYPAANIINFVPGNCEKFLIDPKEITLKESDNVTIIQKKASIGIPILANLLLKKGFI